jgi:hypothetical protein
MQQNAVFSVCSRFCLYNKRSEKGGSTEANNYMGGIEMDDCLFVASRVPFV